MASAEETKELIQALIKAKKNLRIYPDNNPIYLKTLDDIYSQITSILDYTQSIVFKIKQYDIIFNDEVIYHSKEKDESLALFFFKDGIRELTLKRGIPRDEVEEFIKIISLDFGKGVLDDDIVTLMWERDFQFIQYIVDDTFLLEDETYEDRSVEQVRSVSAKSEEILKAYEDASGVERTSGINIVPLTNDDLKSIIQEIENEPSDKTPALVRLLFEMLYYAEGKGDYEAITGFIKNALEYSITLGNLETAIYTIKKVRRAVEQHTYPESLNPDLIAIEHHINSARFIKLFGEVLDSGAYFSNDILNEFSSLLNKSSIPHFITILGELTQISSRKAIINILSELGKKDVPLVARGLNDRRWYVVRNIIYILRQIGDRTATEHLTRAVHHPDSRVRKETIRALGETGSGEVLPTLKDFMSDVDESIRIASVRSIGLIGTPASKKLILDKVHDKKFRDRSFSEKREFFEVLARWNESDVVDTLINILNKKAFFRRAKNDETRAAAAYYIGTMGVNEAVDVLGKLANSKNKLLRDNAIIALKRIND